MEPAKILIVEDEVFLRDLYVDTLSPEGYQLDTAVDGEEAYEKIKDGTYDLVLLDIILPKMSAFQILEKLNSEPEFTTKPHKIVFMTNLDNDVDIKRALSLGGDGYLIKSQITPGDLIKEVKIYLTKAEENKTPDIVSQS